MDKAHRHRSPAGKREQEGEDTVSATAPVTLYEPRILPLPRFQPMPQLNYASGGYYGQHQGSSLVPAAAQSSNLGRTLPYYANSMNQYHSRTSPFPQPAHAYLPFSIGGSAAMHSHSIQQNNLTPPWLLQFQLPGGPTPATRERIIMNQDSPYIRPLWNQPMARGQQDFDMGSLMYQSAMQPLARSVKTSSYGPGHMDLAMRLPIPAAAGSESQIQGSHFDGQTLKAAPNAASKAKPKGMLSYQAPPTAAPKKIIELTLSDDDDNDGIVVNNKADSSLQSRYEDEDDSNASSASVDDLPFPFESKLADVAAELTGQKRKIILDGPTIIKKIAVNDGYEFKGFVFNTLQESDNSNSDEERPMPNPTPLRTDYATDHNWVMVNQNDELGVRIKMEPQSVNIKTAGLEVNNGEEHVELEMPVKEEEEKVQPVTIKLEPEFNSSSISEVALSEIAENVKCPEIAITSQCDEKKEIVLKKLKAENYFKDVNGTGPAHTLGYLHQHFNESKLNSIQKAKMIFIGAPTISAGLVKMLNARGFKDNIILKQEIQELESEMKLLSSKPEFMVYFHECDKGLDVDTIKALCFAIPRLIRLVSSKKRVEVFLYSPPTNMALNNLSAKILTHLIHLTGVKITTLTIPSQVEGKAQYCINKLRYCATATANAVSSMELD